VGDIASPCSGQGTTPAALRFEYRLDEQLPLTVGPTYRHIERWAVVVLADSTSPDTQPVEIGYAYVLVFNLEPDDDIRDLTDPTSGTWIDKVTSGRQARRPCEPDGAEGSPASHVLVLDRVWLRPDSRGQGLGPIIAAAVIERLGRGCQLAACYPAPFEDPTQHPNDRDRAIEALGKLWSKVGFSPWRDGVWMLDFNTSDRHATLAQLLAANRDRPDHAQLGN
jgi:GNAT superfamily N-acetyltransferase